jgi:carbon-monoxide dehydrogenase small subunit
MKGMFIINDQRKQLSFASDERLLVTLRNNGYKEVKNGCQEGECGACLVLLNEQPVNSCQILTASVQGQDIKTVKGIGDLHAPHIIQKAFVQTGAIQCGFCSPGFIISTYALLQNNPQPDAEQIKQALSGNLCRCTGYVKIIEAVKLAARKLQEEN